MNMRTHPATLFFFFFLTCGPLLAQSKVKPKDIPLALTKAFENNLFLQFQINATGDFRASSGFKNHRYREDQLPFFECDDLWLELELDTEQQKSIKKTIRSWRADHERSYAKANKRTGDHNQNIKMMHQEMTESTEESVADISNILNTAQRKRLGQLRIRYLIRKFGLVKVLSHPVMSGHLKLKQKDLPGLKLHVQKTRKEVDKKFSQNFRAAVGNFLKPLDKDSQEDIFSKWPFLKKPTGPDCDRLRVQLTFCEPFKEFKHYKNSIEKITRFPSYFVNASGQIIVQHPKNDQPDYIFKINQSFRKVDLMVSDLPEALNISEKQKKQFGELEVYFHTNVVLNPSERKGLTSSQYFKKLYREIEERIDIILTPPQKKRWGRLFDESLTLKLGPAYDLLHGGLGEALELTDSKKKELRKSIKDALKEFEMDLIKTEAFWIKSATSVLSKRQKQKLFLLIGPMPEHSPPVVGIYRDSN